ncbi:Neutral metalloproteinase OS=Streptomyces antimycoticus OX=68175 GN=SANT12839_065330 PE=3 SV=1 [Streptomyces antimycoticus]
MPISGAGKRRSVIAAGTVVAAAALLASGMTTGTAGAAPAKSGGQPTALTASARAELLREANATKADTASSLGLGAKEKLVVKDVIKDADGTTHTRYDRTYDGLPVLGGDLIVHKAKGGDVKSVTKATKATVKVASTAAGIAPSTAAKAAVKLAKADDTTQAAADQAPRKVIWAATGKPMLAYETIIGGVQKDGTPNQLHVITDAATGKKLYEYQAIETGKNESEDSGSVELGTSKEGSGYTLTDADRGGHKTTNLENGEEGEGKAFTDDDDNWGTGKPDDPQTAAVDAHYRAAATWNYYKNVHGRNSIAGNGKGAYSRVHYGDSYVNAFWDDSCFCMTYGNGAGNKAPLTALNMAGHEMTTASPPGPAGVGTPLRYMDKPSKDGLSYDYWKSGVGNDDPHFTSGIANHFFYLLAEGSGRKVIGGVTYNSPTKDGRTVKGIGRAKAEKIWYKALSSYMTSTTNYAKARTATLKAAKALYGASSTEYKAVDNAWGGVNVE